MYGIMISYTLMSNRSKFRVK